MINWEHELNNHAMPKSKTIFLLGSGFTKAAFPAAPINSELVAAIVEHFQKKTQIQRYAEHFGDSNDIEEILTRLDLDAAKNDKAAADRKLIDEELASYFRCFRFTETVLIGNSWLVDFATEVLGKNDSIITLNYDCLLEGLLDHAGVWTPNGGYYGVDNVLTEAIPNPIGITVYKIHGSEHFRISSFFDKPEQSAIAYEFDETIFPRSAVSSHFGGGINSGPYVIAPSFVKFPHRQIAMMMLRVLEVAQQAENLVIVGCGLRREDSFLWLLVTRFLLRKSQKELIIVDPNAAEIEQRVHQYWAGDLTSWAKVSRVARVSELGEFWRQR